MGCDNRTTAEQIADEIAGFDLGQFLVNTGQRLSAAFTTDGFGGRTQAWTPIGDAFPCHLGQKAPGTPVDIGERTEQAGQPYILKVGRSTTLYVDDRVTVDGAATYQVLSTQDADTVGLFNIYWCFKVDF